MRRASVENHRPDGVLRRLRQFAPVRAGRVDRSEASKPGPHGGTRQHLHHALRKAQVAGKEKGTYVGPTVIDYVTADMSVAREEIFGPVISIMRTNTVDEALEIENANPYGNAASVFTQNGAMARYIIDKANAGMIGVNVGVPVPREPFSFGGWNESKFGVGDITGKSSIEFWTKLKKSTVKWNAEAGVNWMS